VVQVVTIADGTAAQSITASGLIGYRRETPLAFNVGGVVESIAVDDGDRVRRGQALARLRQTQVQAGTAEAEAVLANAEQNLNRVERLFERGIVAQARLDDARTAVTRARAARDSAQFTRGTASLTAAADGIILRRTAEPGQVVGPGQPVLVLGEQDSGWILRVAVQAAAATRLRAGLPVEVHLDGIAPSVRAGTIARIAGQSSPSTGAFDVEINLANASGLRSGMVGRARLTVPPDSQNPGLNAVRIPALSLFDARADQGVVFVVDAAGIAHRRTVQTAGVDDEAVLVVSGLSPGDRVVAAGAAYVRDGEAVTVAVAP
jgi:RND family efflux transporter MFP subunit